jgi:hypothetical protein
MRVVVASTNEELRMKDEELRACCKNGDRTFEFRGPVPDFATGNCLL